MTDIAKTDRLVEMRRNEDQVGFFSWIFHLFPSEIQRFLTGFRV